VKIGDDVIARRIFLVGIGNRTSEGFWMTKKLRVCQTAGAGNHKFAGYNDLSRQELRRRQADCTNVKNTC